MYVGQDPSTSVLTFGNVVYTSKTMNKKFSQEVMITKVLKWLHNRRLNTLMCPCGWKMRPTYETLRTVKYV